MPGLPIQWTSAALARLGLEPDAVIAADLGVATQSVWRARTARGIPAFRPVARGVLSAADVRKIRRRAAAGELQSALAKEFGVAPGVVSSYVVGRSRQYDGGPIAPPLNRTQIGQRGWVGQQRALGRRIGKRRRDAPQRTARINLPVEPHVRETWHAAAERAGVSLSEYVRVAVEARLAKETR